MAIQTIAAPAHVSPERVVDFDYLAPPGHEEDVHRAWHRLHDMGVPPIVWTPHHGGHWIATRADDIDAMQHRPGALLACLGDGAEGRADFPPGAAGDGPAGAHAVSRPAVAEVRAAAGGRPRSQRASAGHRADRRLHRRGECEFVDAFAKRLPIVVFLRLVDLPLDDRESPARDDRGLGARRRRAPAVGVRAAAAIRRQVDRRASRRSPAPICSAPWSMPR